MWITIFPKKKQRSNSARGSGHQARLSEATHQKLTALSRESGYAIYEIIEIAVSKVRVGRAR